MFLLFAPSVSAQSSPTPTFDVAIIKPAALDPHPGVTELLDRSVDEDRFGEGGGTRANSGLFEARGVTLRMLVAHAYGVPRSRVIGPDWIDSVRYDIVAKIPGKPGLEGFRKMQQQLLSERFNLVLHREGRKTALYRMTVAKSGHKLKPPVVRKLDTPEEIQAALRDITTKSPPMAPGATQRIGHANASLDEIAARIEIRTDLPVKNATGLSGNFGFFVDWSAKEGFRDAVEDQLGLVLTRSNEDLDVLIIDKADRSPTEN
jgi:uncharacterized protein (TIGR03435 family)